MMQPTIVEELDRKTLETIESAILSLSHGRITKQEFNRIIDGIAGCVVGLVSKEVKHIVFAAFRNDAEPFVERRLLVDVSGGVVMIEWAFGSDRIEVFHSLHRDEAGKSIWKKHRTVEALSESRQDLEKLLKVLKQKGYQELGIHNSEGSW